MGNEQRCRTAYAKPSKPQAWRKWVLQKPQSMGNGTMWDYGNGQTLYGWNISDVRIFYPLPMELDDFTGVRASGTWLERYKIQRAPQSWCYVEGLQ